MRCPLCGHDPLQEPWDDDGKYFCNPQSDGCGAWIRRLEVIDEEEQGDGG